MNSSDYTDLATEHHWADHATDIIENYFIRLVGAIGVVFNIFFAVILLNKSLKHKIYNFLWCRAVCYLTLCFLKTELKALLFFSMSVTNLFLFSVQALDGLVYLIMDRNLWRLILVTFKLKKVIQKFH